MSPPTKSPEALCFQVGRLCVCASVIGFHSRDNLRTAEGIKVKLGGSMSNDAYMN